ncbi:MAG: hypothetical protein F6K61_12345 [Sphaerospermopsis sp. SIO1G1]|nr:hypothetical protein [Sphaerospermopsis sp. SIO1G1]
MIGDWVNQDLRNEDLSLRLKRSVRKQSQDFCDYVAVARNDAVTLLLRKSYKFLNYVSEALPKGALRITNYELRITKGDW